MVSGVASKGFVKHSISQLLYDINLYTTEVVIQQCPSFCHSGFDLTASAISILLNEAGPCR